MICLHQEDLARVFEGQNGWRVADMAGTTNKEHSGYPYQNQLSLLLYTNLPKCPCGIPPNPVHLLKSTGPPY